MNTLDQVLLLEQKVESAVAKIQQLQTENDALRKECEELKNALSAKSEQITTFETDKNKIETGIQKALDRLSSIENSVLKSVGQSASNLSDTNTAVTEKQIEAEINPEQNINLTTENLSEQTETEVPTDFSNAAAETADENTMDPSFDTMQTMEFTDEPDENSSEDLGFDIF